MVDTSAKSWYKYHMTTAAFIRATEDGSEVVDLTTLTTDELKSLAVEAGAHGDHEGVAVINAEIASRSTITGAEITVGDRLMTYGTSHNGTVRYDMPVRVLEASVVVAGCRRLLVEYVHSGRRESFLVHIDSRWERIAVGEAAE